MANQKTNPDNDFQLLPIRLAGQHCAKPIDSALGTTGDVADVNPLGQSDLADPLVTNLAFRIAQLLIVWKKSQKFSAAIKSM